MIKHEILFSNILKRSILRKTASWLWTSSKHLTSLFLEFRGLDLISKSEQIVDVLFQRFFSGVHVPVTGFSFSLVECFHQKTSVRTLKKNVPEFFDYSLTCSLTRKATVCVVLFHTQNRWQKQQQQQQHHSSSNKNNSNSNNKHTHYLIYMFYFLLLFSSHA